MVSSGLSSVSSVGGPLALIGGRTVKTRWEPRLSVTRAGKRQVNFFSEFAGMGGFDLLVSAVITALGIERHQPLTHKRDSDLFELVMPVGMSLTLGNHKVGCIVVMFIKVDMVNAFTCNQRASALGRGDKDMLGDIARFVSVGMVRLQHVIVAIPKRRPLASLPLRFSDQYAPAFPGGIQSAVLISLRGLTAFDAHFLHRTPNNLLSCVVLGCDLDLTHPEQDVITVKLFFGERDSVRVFIAHSTGIIPNACKFRKKEVRFHAFFLDIYWNRRLSI